jgi:hypothetical protein
MSDEDLIGYLFDLLDPADRAAIAACVKADPKVAERLERLRAAVGPVLAVAEVEREESPEPPPGLALRAIARVAQHVVEHEPRPKAPASEESPVAAFLREFADPPSDEMEFDSGTRAKKPRTATEPSPPPTDGPEYRGVRFRADMLVAACIAFVGLGLVFSGIAKARHQSRVYACQNNLRTLSVGLTGYADHDPQGRYPQVGTDVATADACATALVDLGYLTPEYKPGCPAATECRAYTYTLGFRGANDELVGLRRPIPTDPSDPPDESDLMPISADLPSADVSVCAGPVSPHAACMNVLFVGGNVRLTKSPNVGPRGDHIYRNVYGHIAAGANRSDAVLGGPGTRP